jgi:hypothetical protein
MSSVNEWIAREYFEMLGYLVSQPCKYVSTSRLKKKVEEELDLLILQPQVAGHDVPGHMIWTTPDLKGVGRAVVGVRGWHMDRIYAGTLTQTPEFTRFAERAARHAAALRLGSENVAAILCLPDLPASGELKEKTLEALKEKGIDGVLSFHTMLQELVARVDVSRNYEKSDLLQILRIFKRYGFIRNPQLDLFERQTRRKTARP